MQDFSVERSSRPPASSAPIVPGQTYFFKKSGNRVKALEPTTPYLGQPMWEVERVEGVSAGKRMDVPESALVESLD